MTKTDDQMVVEQYSNWNTVRNAFIFVGILAVAVYLTRKK
jgi:hypothetical protein